MFSEQANKSFFYLYIFWSRHHLATPTHPPCHQTSSVGQPTHPPLWWRNTWMPPNLDFDPFNNLRWLVSCPKIFMGLALVHFQKYWLVSTYVAWIKFGTSANLTTKSNDTSQNHTSQKNLAQKIRHKKHRHKNGMKVII